MITSELKRISKQKQATTETSSISTNTLIQAMTPKDPADAVWNEFLIELQLCDEEDLRKTVDQHESEAIDPSFDYLAEQERENQRDNLPEVYQEETRNYRILRNEVEDLKRDEAKMHEQVGSSRQKTLGEQFIEILEESEIIPKSA